MDIVLAVCVLWGRNWARIWLMSVCVLSTTFAFVANVRGHEAITLANLPTVGSSILVLLALSSHRARNYASRTTDRVRWVKDWRAVSLVAVQWSPPSSTPTSCLT